MVSLSLSDLFVVDRSFATAREIKRRVSDECGIEVSGLEALLFFATDKQQSWFVAGPRSLHLVIDKKDEAAPRVRWSVPIETGRAIKVGSKSARTGTVTVGGKRPRLFSKKLFADEPIEHRLRDMLDRAERGATRAA